MTDQLGRPESGTLYSQELAEEICMEIATTGKGLKRLCAANPHWPSKRTIHRWRVTREDFGNMYTRARYNQIETLVDEILEISDDSSADTIIKTNKNGDEYESCNIEWVHRCRLMVDTRKWLAGKLYPKVYGDKVEKSNDEESKALMEKIIDKL